MRVLLVVYDNDSYIHFFPIGMAYIASVLRSAGFEVEIWNQDVHHYSDDELKEFLDNSDPFDIIGVGIIAGYYQYRKILSLSKSINNSSRRPYFVLGGHGPAADPGFFIERTGADCVIIGEGELTIVELAERIKEKQSLKDVCGIAYRGTGGEVIHNEKRELIKNVDSISMPAYDMFPIEYYRLFRSPKSTNRDFCMPMVSGRGCPFRCNFCYRMDKGFRPRSADSIIEEIKYLKSEYRITYCHFADDLLMSSVKRTEELCRAFIKADLKIKWYCNGRLNFAQKDLLGLMKEAGCVFINYGIEAFDDRILKNMNKVLTTEQILKGIEATLQSGISPGFNIIFGNIGESRDTLMKGVDFLLKYDDGAQLRTIRPVTPYPGSPLFYHAIEQGLLKNTADFYDNKHVNSDLLTVNFTEMSDDEFHRALLEANGILLENYYKKIRLKNKNLLENLYINNDETFRGFRHT